MVFLYLKSDQIGGGDPELGQKLMKSFLSEIVKADIKVDVVGCVNAAINLTTKGSEVIDSLTKLQEQGARIASCGSCLDHYKKREELLIGEVGTMAMNIAVMANADRVISPC